MIWEKRKDVDFYNRGEIVNNKIDNTIRSGLCVEADIPNIKNHKVIILRDSKILP